MSVNQEEVRDGTIHAISQVLDVSSIKVTDDTHFVNDLNISSLDTVRLIITLEDEFGIELLDEDAAKVQTVKDAVDCIFNYME